MLPPPFMVVLPSRVPLAIRPRSQITSPWMFRVLVGTMSTREQFSVAMRSPSYRSNNQPQQVLHPHMITVVPQHAEAAHQNHRTPNHWCGPGPFPTHGPGPGRTPGTVLSCLIFSCRRYSAPFANQLILRVVLKFIPGMAYSDAIIHTVATLFVALHTLLVYKLTIRPPIIICGHISLCRTNPGH